MFIEDYFVAHPSYAVYQGRHEFDGQLPDWGGDGIAREVERLHDQRNQAEAFHTGDLNGIQPLNETI